MVFVSRIGAYLSMSNVVVLCLDGVLAVSEAASADEDTQKQPLPVPLVRVALGPRVEVSAVAVALEEASVAVADSIEAALATEAASADPVEAFEVGMVEDEEESDSSQTVGAVHPKEHPPG